MEQVQKGVEDENKKLESVKIMAKEREEKIQKSIMAKSMRENSSKDEEQPQIEIIKDYNDYGDFAAKFRVEEHFGQ